MFKYTSKKILFLILLNFLILPNITLAATTNVELEEFLKGVVDSTLYIASAIVVIGWVITGTLFLLGWGAPEKLGIAKKALFAVVTGTVLVMVAASAGYIVQSALNLGGA